MSRGSAIPADSTQPPRRLVVKRRVAAGDPARLADLLVQHSGLPLAAVELAISRGAAWRRRPNRRGRLRARGADTAIQVGDTVELHYDADLLAREPEPGRCLLEHRRYSVWLKPPGLMSQGTDFGDHCSLQRQVELVREGRAVHLVHRLDRETAGLVLLAHDARAAAQLSRLFREGAVTKRYRALVLGAVAEQLGRQGRITRDLDGKAALTEFSVLSQSSQGHRTVSELELRLGTGRTHQIRRHLAGAGHPVIGDPRYGRGNKDPAGLMLVAHMLEWRCPFSGDPVVVSVDPGELLQRFGGS